MVFLANSINAITDAWGDDVDVIAKAARQEAREVLDQAGLHAVSAEELAQEWPESTIKPRASQPVEAKGSTWQSLARRQGTVESDFLNGEIAQLARKLGSQAPLNEALLRVAHEMAANRETPGKYTPAQLCKLLGLPTSPKH